MSKINAEWRTKNKIPKNPTAEKIEIKLTKKQFLALLKAVYLGNWMANSNRDGSPKDPHIKDYEEIEDLIFSYAQKFRFQKYVDHDPKYPDKYFPTGYFEEETDVDEMHEEYDQYSMWDELCDMLGERDFFRKYSPDEVRKMSREERMEKMHQCIDFYEEEFEKNGLNRLEVMRTMKDLGL